MASEIAWVAQLSCGHVIGSKPPAMNEPEPPPPSVPPWGGYQTPAKAAQPPEPDFVPMPDIEQLWYCAECNEGRFVVGIVENVDQQPANLAEKRAR